MNYRFVNGVITRYLTHPRPQDESPSHFGEKILPKYTMNRRMLRRVAPPSIDGIRSSRSFTEASLNIPQHSRRGEILIRLGKLPTLSVPDFNRSGALIRLYYRTLPPPLHPHARIQTIPDQIFPVNAVCIWPVGPLDGG